MFWMLIFDIMTWACIILYLVESDFRKKGYIALAVAISILLPSIAGGLVFVGMIIRAGIAILFLIERNMPAVSK